MVSSLSLQLSIDSIPKELVIFQEKTDTNSSIDEYAWQKKKNLFENELYFIPSPGQKVRQSLEIKIHIFQPKWLKIVKK